MRLKNRRHGRTTESSRNTSATHIIKMGFDNRAPGASHPVPGKLNGFLICRDRIDADNNLVVDHAIMKRLDPSWNQAKLDEAKRDQLKAADGLLPKTLHFVILRDAEKDTDGVWQYPGTLDESLELWDKIGLKCFGNGETALRRGDDGIQRKIACVPFRAEGVEDARQFCPYSTPRIQKDRRGNDQKIVDCRSHSRLTLCLYTMGENGRPEPLCRELGWKAKYRLDTSSGYNPLRILEELDAAAKRVEGRLHWITGAITFAKQRKRYEGGVATVGQIMFTLSEEDISRREQDLHRQRMESEGRLLETAPTRLLATELPPPVAALDPEDDLRLAAARAERPFPAESELPEDEDENAQEPEGVDEIPWGDEPKPVELPTPAPVQAPIKQPSSNHQAKHPVDDASPEQLVDALIAFVKAVNAEEGCPLAETWQRLGAIDLPNGSFRAPKHPNSFLDDSPEWPAADRLAALRALCVEHVNNDIRFLLPEPTAAVG
jgi:hypothetical protein